MFSIIAAVGKNGELGTKGQLIFRLKDDMKFFRETTLNHQIVMGRKTWNSFPGKLPNRKNIVISHYDFDGPDAIIHDIDQFISDHKDSPEEIFIIGGGAIYTKFLPHAKNLYLTEIDAPAAHADAFFPKFDKSKYSHKVIKKGKEDDLVFTITKYIKYDG